MKKVIFVVLVALLVSLGAYGQCGWADDGTVVRLSTSTDQVGIGTDSPIGKLEVKDTSGAESKIRITSATDASAVLALRENSTDRWVLANIGTDSDKFYFKSYDGSWHNVMVLEQDGDVGIGTTTPQSELAVNGTVTAKEVIVTLDGWSDFVFADNYKLMPLNKLEKHIEVNKSLPGIPTEKEVLENGVSLGEMQAKFLEKIEELTLYVINQDRELAELKKDNEELRKANENLENRISALEK